MQSTPSLAILNTLHLQLKLRYLTFLIRIMANTNCFLNRWSFSINTALSNYLLNGHRVFQYYSWGVCATTTSFWGGHVSTGPWQSWLFPSPCPLTKVITQQDNTRLSPAYTLINYLKIIFKFAVNFTASEAMVCSFRKILDLLLDAVFFLFCFEVPAAAIIYNPQFLQTSATISTYAFLLQLWAFLITCYARVKALKTHHLS